MTSDAQHGAGRLRRGLGVPGATMMGLGSIVGTGVFVSIGVAAGVSGPAVIPAIALAAVVASCNAFSSAQLAASHPVAGGTYEYGYRYLSPFLGFTAGWMFLCAKTASAATAALGFAGYLLHAFGAAERGWVAPIAVAATVLLTVLVLAGIRRSSLTNSVIVSITLASLAAFVLAGLPALVRSGLTNLTPVFSGPGASGVALADFLHATALMFVAYTGYARIATLGEEVVTPRRTIPRAISVTLVLTAALYILVGLVAVGTLGAERLAEAAKGAAAPLEVAAVGLGLPGLRWIVTVGAVTAMLGVLLNLILGLSRVLLAMGRRRDLPRALARLNPAETTPYVAVIVTAALIAALATIGSVRTTWSFSAFTVLIYYGITNLAALRLPRQERLYPPAVAWGGLIGCLFLAFWVDWWVWLAGLGLIAGGALWHLGARRLRP